MAARGRSNSSAISPEIYVVRIIVHQWTPRLYYYIQESNMLMGWKYHHGEQEIKNSFGYDSQWGKQTTVWDGNAYKETKSWTSLITCQSVFFQVILHHKYYNFGGYISEHISNTDAHTPELRLFSNDTHATARQRFETLFPKRQEKSSRALGGSKITFDNPQ